MVGCREEDVPPLLEEPSGGWPEPTANVSGLDWRRQREAGRKPLQVLGKRERRLTPAAFAAWLVELASRCGGGSRTRSYQTRS